jgi:hypothetical protein
MLKRPSTLVRALAVTLGVLLATNAAAAPKKAAAPTPAEAKAFIEKVNAD